MQASELVEDVTSHGSHAGAAPDEDHLCVGIFGEELPVGATDGHFVPWFEVEDVR